MLPAELDSSSSVFFFLWFREDIFPCCPGWDFLGSWTDDIRGRGGGDDLCVLYVCPDLAARRLVRYARSKSRLYWPGCFARMRHLSTSSGLQS